TCALPTSPRPRPPRRRPPLGPAPARGPPPARPRPPRPPPARRGRSRPPRRARRRRPRRTARDRRPPRPRALLRRPPPRRALRLVETAGMHAATRRTEPLLEQRAVARPLRTDQLTVAALRVERDARLAAAVRLVRLRVGARVRLLVPATTESNENERANGDQGQVPVHLSPTS